MNELSGLRLRSDSFLVILFENLVKQRQLRLTVGMGTNFVSSICNLKAVL